MNISIESKAAESLTCTKTYSVGSDTTAYTATVASKASKSVSYNVTTFDLSNANFNANSTYKVYVSLNGSISCVPSDMYGSINNTSLTLGTGSKNVSLPCTLGDYFVDHFKDFNFECKGSDFGSTMSIKFDTTFVSAWVLDTNYTITHYANDNFLTVEIYEIVEDVVEPETPDDSGSTAVSSDRVYHADNYSITGEHLSLSNDTELLDLSFPIDLGYNFNVDSSYRVSCKVDYNFTGSEYYNMTSELPYLTITNNMITLGGVEYPFSGEGAVSFEYTPLTNSDNMIVSFSVGDIFFPSDLTGVAQYKLTYNVNVTDITVTRTSGRTTNEILEDMETQDSITQDIINDQLKEQEEQTETQKGIWDSIKDFFGSFFDNLINSIIHVLVPTSDEMSDLFNRLNDFFAETFGFLYYPFDFIIDAFNIFLEADSETGLTFPGFSIMGHEVWPDMTYDLTSEPIVNTIFGYVRMGTGAMLAMWFVNYLRNFFDKRFGGGGS